MDTETSACELQRGEYCSYCSTPEYAKHRIESLSGLLSPQERKVVLHRFIDHLESHPSIEKLDQTNCYVSSSDWRGITCDACKKLLRRAEDLYELLNGYQKDIVLVMCYFDRVRDSRNSCKERQIATRDIIQTLERMTEEV